MADEALTAGAVARRLGVAVTTLRTWHQRYGLGPSKHAPGQHRRYTAEDLNRLQVMRRLTAQGVPPAEAAAWARRTVEPPALSDGLPTAAAAPGSVEPGASAPGSLPPGSSAAGSSAAGSSAAGSLAVGSGGPGSAGPGSTARDGGGGRTIATGRSIPLARGLARAAVRLDGPAQRDILEQSIAEHGVIATWNDVILPVLSGISERYRATSQFIEVEHLISRVITEVFISIPRPPSTRIPRVLLAAADEELHTLPLEALAAALAEAGVATRFLGARTPPGALAAAVARTGPTVVVLWSQLTTTGDPAQLARLLTGPYRPMLVAVAGPGWPVADLPPGVTPLASLEEAVRVILTAVF